MMTKSPEAFRTISEVAETLDVPPHVLRFWETRFAQVKPVKRGGGRRYYRPEDVRLLRGIRGLLYDDGMTIKGVQKILRERGIRHVIGLGTADIDWLVPHQANLRIMAMTAHKLGVPMERVVVTVQDHGNTSAASIPLALSVAHGEGRILPGDVLLMEAIGGGLAWGAAVLRW